MTPRDLFGFLAPLPEPVTMQVRFMRRFPGRRSYLAARRVARRRRNVQKRGGGR